MPDWYIVLDLAREWGVPPWELESAPIEWLVRGLTLSRIRSSVKVSS